MITWWQQLSFSHAALVLVLIAITVIGATLYARRPRHGASRVRETSKSWPIVDYSAQYRAKAAWLGDRYLLAKPINRRTV